MKKIIYISGLFGLLLLLLRVMGFVFEVLQQDLLIYAGLGILLFINLPFYLTGAFLKARRSRRIKKENKAIWKTAVERSENKKSKAAVEVEEQAVLVDEYEKVI